MASAALMTGCVVTTGGITALVARMVGRKKTGKTGISNHLDEGNKDYDYIDEQDGTFESRFPGRMAGSEERVAEG
jgi:hypothetical protein